MQTTRGEATERCDRVIVFMPESAVAKTVRW
jgi:hypothetical protein